MRASAMFTVVARNYLAYARTLMNSAVAFEPSIERYVFLVDGDGQPPELAGVTVLNPADIFDYELYAGLAYSSDVTELSTAVKPFVLRYLLDRGYERAYYFDPDIELFAQLDPLTQPLAGADIVLTPHITEPIPLDGELPDEIALLRAGAYNLGFIGVAHTAAARSMLDWWAERLERYCVNDVGAGLFTDQKWIDLVPGMVDRVAIVRHRGCNVAYWNLQARRLDPADPRRLASGEPLVFFHYSGFDVRSPGRLSKHQTRIVVSDDPPLAALLRGYAGRVLANGFAAAAATAYGFSRFSNGVPLDVFSRTVLREARLDGIRFPDPGDVSALPSAWRYLNERAAEDTNRHASPSITRYLYGVWRKRIDLRAAFPDVLDADRERFAAWLRTDYNTGVHAAYLAEAGVRLRAKPDPDHDDVGVNVVGYFRSESGVGEAGRGQIAALREAGIRARLVDVSELAPSRAGETIVDGGDQGRDHRINLVCVNADQIPNFEDWVGPSFFAGHYNIGSWWWELPQFPEVWTPAFRPFDEIWAGTQFVVSALAPKSPVPVVHVPPVVDVGAVRRGRKRDFGLHPDETAFLFMFDYRSGFERKNPLGAVEAFRRAFPDERNVRLVLKSINAEADPKARDRLRRAVANDRRIVIAESYLTRDEKNELLAACDAYVSLHRSEGFGYTIAEAMLLAKPVIATPWSGPAEFMTGSNSFPVRFELVEVDADYGPHSVRQFWADPDLDDAARAMRAVHEQPARAALLGEHGSADIAARYSPVAVGAIVADRIMRIARRFGAGASP